MSRLAGAVLIFAVLLMSAVPSYGDGIKVIVDGKKVATDVKPVFKQATVFVPLRGVLEELKAVITFDKKTGTITAKRKKSNVVLVVDSTKAKVNGVATFMPIPAFIKEGRTLVPLRFISQALGCQVKWEPQYMTVHISSRGDSGDDIDVDVKDLDDDIK
ncbi:MAG: copper amine oxidase N-terminal domain-containing protein [Vulcanimicrobiota bacterium]